MTPTIRTYELTPASADEAAALVEQFCDAAGCSRKDTLRYRLTVEDVILRWSEKQASDRFTIALGRRFRKYFIALECMGGPADPFAEEQDAAGVFVHDFRENLGFYPQYSYKNGKNRSVLQFSGKQLSALTKILCALFGAFLFGMLLKLLWSQSSTDAFLTSFIEPLYSAAFRLLGYMAGPLVLLSVMWGIYGIGDATTLGRLGKDLIARFLLVSFALSLCCTLTFPLFRLNIVRETSGASAFRSVFEMLLDIIPTDVISPLTTNNTLQIIFSAVIIGVAMLILGKKVDTFANVIGQVNAIISMLMEFISRLIPAVVFLIILRMILSDSLILFVSIWQLALIFIAESIVFCVVVTVLTGIKQRVSPWTILKKRIPTFLITITTASSAAAFSSNMETCEKKFGIDNSLSSFGIPLGMVIYKTGSVIYYVLVSLYFAKIFEVPVSVGWIISAGFLSVVMSFSCPPVPSGAAIAYTLLFNRLGLPDDALAIVLSIEVIFDFLVTSVNIYCLPIALLNSAAVQGLLNREVLRSRGKKTQEAD